MFSAPALDLSTIPVAQRAVVTTLIETITALQKITLRQQQLIAEKNHRQTNVVNLADDTGSTGKRAEDFRDREIGDSRDPDATIQP